jgi:hypothetical protein
MIKKFERIPEKWKIVCDECCFDLVDAEGEIKSSIRYRFDEDSSGRKFIYITSVASRQQGKGHYGLLYSRLESLAKTKGVAYFSGFIKYENLRSIQVHEHLGFYPLRYFVYGNEKRIEVRKDISI